MLYDESLAMELPRRGLFTISKTSSPSWSFSLKLARSGVPGGVASFGEWGGVSIGLEFELRGEGVC